MCLFEFCQRQGLEQLDQGWKRSWWRFSFVLRVEKGVSGEVGTCGGLVFWFSKSVLEEF